MTMAGPCHDTAQGFLKVIFKSQRMQKSHAKCDKYMAAYRCPSFRSPFVLTYNKAESPPRIGAEVRGRRVKRSKG
jgi:hypothetical protein